MFFSILTATPPAVNAEAAIVSQVWRYVGEMIFSVMILVGSIKASDRIVREMMGL